MNSVKTTLRILNLLSEPPYELNLTQIANQLGMAKSGILRYMRNLVEENYVSYNKTRRCYYLGPVLMRLGNTFLKYKGFSGVIEQILAHVSALIGETTYICIWENGTVYPVYKYAKPGAVYSLDDFIGSAIPINAGASALLLLSFQDAAIREEVLEKASLVRCTEKTITDYSALQQEIKKIREQGYALEYETFDPGIMGISVPVYDRMNSVKLSLSLAAPIYNSSPEKIEQWLGYLREGADKIYEKLKYSN